ncbi:MAG: DNA-directed RNA polymerase subunit omega [Wolbachia endosymbiont of Fragariocoptes setiger]|nr:DNA-directed RNA polymerase subunit omega [Wolbachia endosymbiont of Fragariocoptes setiger]
MADFIVEKCIENINNHFKLVLLASQRTHDLNIGAGDSSQVAKLKKHKNTVATLHEIAENKVCTNELFNSLVKRCKEYTEGKIGNTSDEKLKRLLNFPQN